jgi:hypothetical protein
VLGCTLQRLFIRRALANHAANRVRVIGWSGLRLVCTDVEFGLMDVLDRSGAMWMEPWLPWLGCPSLTACTQRKSLMSMMVTVTALVLG